MKEVDAVGRSGSADTVGNAAPGNDVGPAREVEQARDAGRYGDADLQDAWCGSTPEEWAARFGVPSLELHRRLPSTNAHLRELAYSGAKPFTTIVADEQTRGRGRAGRTWHSPPNSGLWLSTLLSAEAGGAAGVLPLAVGVAVAVAIEGVTGVTVALKWPNDVLLGSSKVAGILCESVGATGSQVAVGVGLNLRRPPEGFPPELASSVGFLCEFTEQPIREPDLAGAIIEQLRRWAQPAPEALVGELRAHWELRDCLRGESVVVEPGLTGNARGVSREGGLEILLASGAARTIMAGSVRLSRAAEAHALHGATRRAGGG